MNFSGITSVSGHVKNMSLNVKWQARKSDPQKYKEEDPEIAKIKMWSEDQRRSQAIASIHGKMMAGKELSKDEMEYLRANNPELYQKAVDIQKERELYKQELASCRSKEDVEKLKQRRLHQFASEAKAISSNPNIPKAKKLELLEFLTMRMNGIINDHAKFIESREYQALPDKTDEDEIETIKNDIVLKNNDLPEDTENPEKEIADPVEFVNDFVNRPGSDIKAIDLSAIKTDNYSMGSRRA